MKNKGLLIVLSGPSGVGKGTVIKRLFEIKDNLHYSVSATTRLPREGEKDGINYYFITKELFEKRIENNEMLEYAEYCGNYYGTPKETVLSKLNEGVDVILEIDVQGALKVKKAYDEALMIFIMPPDIHELTVRLRGRNTEDEAVISKRIDAAVLEIKSAHLYDYTVINDKVEKAASEIAGIIDAEKVKRNI